MTSKAQITANRENATHSTGPRTEEGKAASSQNARKHGFNSSRLVIPEELREEFDEHRESLHADLKPLDALALDLFHQLLHASWNLRRIELLQLEAFSAGDPFADEKAHPRLQLLMRYHAHFHRVYQRVLKTFEQHQSSIVALVNGVPPETVKQVPTTTNVHAIHKARMGAMAAREREAIDAARIAI